MKMKPVILSALLCAALIGAGCTSVGVSRVFTEDYVAMTDAGYQLPEIPLSKVPSQYLRQLVEYDTAEEPGTVVVDTQAKFLYFVMPDGQAMRYGIGVGREGFEWKGTARVAFKREWPRWTPPAEMIRRQPELAKWRGGMPGGLDNPLGARALYLYRGGNDTGYRLHGTPEWNSIGHAVSSGCIRLMNQDVIDLHARVKNGAKVIVT
jgi:lipoprotein-anchoring transpeptidase ErfK/SrfK